MSNNPAVLYRIQWVEEPGVEAKNEDAWGEVESWDAPGAPDGWAEHCIEMGWPADTEFFLPSINKTYRTREGAEGRAALVNRWGGNCEVIATTTSWLPLAEHDLERAKTAAHVRMRELDKERDRLQEFLYGNKPF